MVFFVDSYGNVFRDNSRDCNEPYVPKFSDFNNKNIKEMWTQIRSMIENTSDEGIELLNDFEELVIK